MNKARLAFVLMSCWSLPAHAQRLDFGDEFPLWMYGVPAIIALGLAILFMLRPERRKQLGVTVLGWLGYVSLAVCATELGPSIGLFGVIAIILALWVLAASLACVYVAYRARPGKP